MFEPRDVENLLGQLCVTFGFCLRPEARAMLMADPPEDDHEFADLVLRAEGMDPMTTRRRLVRRLRDQITAARPRAD